MADDFETGYQPIGNNSEVEDEETEDAPPGENIIHVVPDKNRARWNHIINLDEFFSRIYQYHQRSGFICMVAQDILQLIQFAFVVLFSVFLMKCVDYETLFYDRWYNTTHKVTIPEGIYPIDQCLQRFDPVLIICVIVAVVFWMFRLVKCVYNIVLYTEIRAFYNTALKITADELPNMTWHEVQKKLLEVQKEQQMCVHKQELSELDIYHRILRFKNYLVAMTNKDLLPVKYTVPFAGEYTFLTTGLRYNLDIILFWGPWAPFENYWHLNPEYKNYHKRKDLAEFLSQKILLIGIANFVLFPLIMLWQILYSFFRYAEIIKREPGALGARRWSSYARLYLRHFNELDHEFNARLNRGYRPAQKYMDLFASPFLALLAKHIAFIAGSIFAVLIVLTVIDEDFLQVQHVLTVMTVLAAVIAVCRACIPDEHIVWCPEFLVKAVLAQTHYMPDTWKGTAHTYKTRDEFSTLYQYKFTYLFEELLSPLITPFILCFSFRQKSLDIVDFYRNFTVEVTGVGDVCSFAQMDIRKHGNPQWVPEDNTDATQYQQAEGGKTEMSLVHFTLTNPAWKPPQQSVNFMHSLREQVQRDAAVMSLQPLDNPLANSLHSLTSVGFGYNSMYTSTIQQSQMQQTMGTHSALRSSGSGNLLQMSSGDKLPVVRGGLKNAEGPLEGSGGLLSSLHASQGISHQPGATSFMGGSQSFQVDQLGRPVPVARGMMGQSGTRNFDEETLEHMSMEMSFSALYMHELHRRRVRNPLNPYFDNEEDAHARAMWNTMDSPDQPQNLTGHPGFRNSGVRNPLSPTQSGQQLHNLSPLSTPTPGYNGSNLGSVHGGQSRYPFLSQLQQNMGVTTSQEPGQQGYFTSPSLVPDNHHHQHQSLTLSPLEGGQHDNIELQPLNLTSMAPRQQQERGFVETLQTGHDSDNQTLPHVRGPYGPSSSHQQSTGLRLVGSGNVGPAMPHIKEEDSMDASFSTGEKDEKRPLIDRDSSLKEL